MYKTINLYGVTNMYFIARKSKTTEGRVAIVPDLTVPVGKTVTPMQFTDETEALLAAAALSSVTGDEFFVLPVSIPVDA
jgi:hypothetical protein